MAFELDNYPISGSTLISTFPALAPMTACANTHACKYWDLEHLNQTWAEFKPGK